MSAISHPACNVEEALPKRGETGAEGREIAADQRAVSFP